MIEVLLILENEYDIQHYLFSSSEDLEKYLNTINQKEYIYKNILFIVDGEVNHIMSKIYKKKYLR